MGFVDRGGGREAKGSSLRRSTKNPGAPTTRHKSANKTYTTPATRDTPIPPPTSAALVQALAAAEHTATDTSAYEAALAAVVQDVVRAGAPPSVDAAVALLSRKLEDDRDGILRRAAEEAHLAALVCWCGEVERQSLLLDTCVQHNKLHRGAAEQQRSRSGGTTAAAAPATTTATTRHVRFMEDTDDHVAAATTPGAALASITTATAATAAKTSASVSLYAVLGIHVDNIDRVNMRLHDQWVKELETNVKHSDVVGVLTGLNLSRDLGTHYAQERLLKACWRVAAEARLPLMLHLHAADDAALTQTVNRAAELLHELFDAADSDDAGGGGGTAPTAVVLHNGLRALHASTAMQQLVKTRRPAAPAAAAAAAAANTALYVLVTADGLTTTATAAAAAVSATSSTPPPQQQQQQSDGGPSAEALAALLPPRTALGTTTSASSSDAAAPVHLTQLLIGTGAPWGTPQIMPDAHLRTLPNEPGNYMYVVETIHQAMAAPTAASLTSADLLAVATMNHTRLYFHACITSAKQQQQQQQQQQQHQRSGSSGSDSSSSSSAEDGVDASAAEQQRQQQWIAAQQPAAPTAVAGLAEDSKEKRDLAALLAEAARERERVALELEREEAAREQARAEELQERRSRREKKKNVKANNRSNFSHFRNKDFAPNHGSRTERDADRSGGSNNTNNNTNNAEEEEEEEEDRDGGGKAHPREVPPQTSELSDSDDAAGSGGLAAEVQRLMERAHPTHRDPQRVAGRGKAARAQAAVSRAEAEVEDVSGGARRAGKGRRAPPKAAHDDSSDAEEEGEEGGAAELVRRDAATMQSSRRQRKRQQKRQQQLHQHSQQDGGDSSDEDS